MRVLPSFRHDWKSGKSISPRIQVLEVRGRECADEPPIAHVLVERTETCRTDADGAVIESSVELTFQLLTGGSQHAGATGQFCAHYDGWSQRVGLTGGGVFMDLPKLKGERIGTYLMNEIVRWAKRWPSASVQSIALLEGQAKDDNRERRNRFYEQFGIVFDYENEGRRVGRSRAMSAAELVESESWRQNIRERDVPSYLAEVLALPQTLGWRLTDSERRGESLLRELHAAEDRLSRRGVLTLLVFVSFLLLITCTWILLRGT